MLQVGAMDDASQSVEIVVPVLPLHVVLPACLEILRKNHVPVPPHSLHPSLLADSSNIRRRDLLRPTHIILQIHLLAEVHLRSEGLEDQPTLPTVGHWEFNFPVQSPRAQEGGIQSVFSVCGHDDLHSGVLVESVHLVEKLQKDSLHLTIRPSLRIESLRSNRIHLINEHNARFVLPRQPEHISDHSRALSQVLLDEFGAHHTDEGGSGLVGHGLGKHGLARPGGAVEKHTARGVNTDLGVEVLVGQRKLHSLLDLLLLDIQPSDVRVGDIRLLLHGHGLHCGVSLRRQEVHHRMGVPVQSHAAGRLQLLSIQRGQHPHVVAGGGSGGHDGVALVNHLAELANDQRD
mmetsp:Transcript_4465/g.10380  ORF Transcript_4465/g.10380 Transcript_4465/m.10380 type:complete len:347 (-) Transcript_4465:220-1260(-)